jgi:hypothetical protein
LREGRTEFDVDLGAISIDFNADLWVMVSVIEKVDLVRGLWARRE